MPTSLYPVFGLVQMILEPQLLVKTLGMEQLNIHLNTGFVCSGAPFRGSRTILFCQDTYHVLQASWSWRS